MLKQLMRWSGVVALAVTMTACADLLEVQNTNNPETARVLVTPADVEKLIADSYNAWFSAVQDYNAIGIQMEAMAFEISPMAANFGMIERSALPRTAPNNQTSDAFSGQYYANYSSFYRAISSASDGLGRLDAGVSLGANDARARAFAKFVQGIGHGSLAMVSDSMFVVDETSDLATIQLVGYQDGLTAALTKLDEAIAIAQANPFTLPSTWINGNEFTSAEFIQMARSYKAQFRANAPRTSTETVDWDLVIADATAGITTNLNVTSDFNTWFFGPALFHSFYGAWNQINYFFIGMADVSGAYQTWAAIQPVTTRVPFVVVTPDQRWPQGATALEQGDAPGSFIRYKGTSGHVLADRGTWRWSFYQNNRYQAFYNGDYLGPFALMQKAEMDFLIAEGHIEGGNPALALPILNGYRAAAGLPAATVTGVTGAACVPRLPNNSCGDLKEVLKYEKRMETMYIAYGGWFFDARRWDDLPVGTQLDYPIPARELEAIGKSLYTRGGPGAAGGAVLGTYGF